MEKTELSVESVNKTIKNDEHDCGKCPFEKLDDGTVVETWRELSSAGGGYYLNVIKYKAIDHKVDFVKNPVIPKPKIIPAVEPIIIDIGDDDEISREDDADKADEQIGSTRSDKEPDHMVVVKSENIISMNIGNNNDNNKQEDKSETVSVNSNVSCHNNLLNQSSPGLTKGKESKSQAVKDVTQVKITSNDNNNSNQNQNIPSKRRKSSSDLSSSTSGSSDAIKRKSLHGGPIKKDAETRVREFIESLLEDMAETSEVNLSKKECQTKVKDLSPLNNVNKLSISPNLIVNDKIDYDEENSIDDNKSIISSSFEEERDSMSNTEFKHDSKEGPAEGSSKESVESSADNMDTVDGKTSRIELGCFKRSVYPIKEAVFFSSTHKVLQARSLVAKSLNPHPFYFKNMGDVPIWDESQLVPLPEELTQTQINQIKKGMLIGKLYNISRASLKKVFPRFIRAKKEVPGTKTLKRCPLCVKSSPISTVYSHIEHCHTSTLLVCMRCHHVCTGHVSAEHHLKFSCKGTPNQHVSSSSSDLSLDDDIDDDIEDDIDI